MKPRQLIFRGRVEAAGVVIDDALVGPARMRQRVLQLWSSDCTAFRTPAGVCVLLGRNQTFGADQLPGAPLVRLAPPHHRLLSTCPLDHDEIEALDLPSKSNTPTLILALGAKAHVVPLTAETKVDVSGWIDVDDFELVGSKTLGADPVEAISATPEPPPSARELFAKVVGAPSAEQVEFRRSLREPGRAEPGFFSRLFSSLFGTRKPVDLQPGQVAESRVVLPAPTPGRESFFDRLLRAFSGLFRPRAASGPGGSSTGSAPKSVAAPPPPKAPARSWWDRLPWRWLDRLGLLRPFQNRQARYLRNLMDMFEKGDIEEALRHAIPLSDKPSEGGGGVSLSTPTPRSSLEISGMSLPSRSRSLALGPHLFDLLKEHYRRAYEKLVRDNRIEEAAFVLAELLEDIEEAVALLERHGKLRMAAELAESRKLSAPLVVRQWIVAGNWKRALAITRERRVFAEAIALLSRKEPAQADVLRLVWGEERAEAGDYQGAVDAVWDIESARPLAKKWIQHAIDDGGKIGARMLVNAIITSPEQFEELRRRVLAICHDPGPESVAERLALANALHAQGPTAETRVLTRPVTRAVAEDAGKHKTGVRRARLLELTKRAGAGVLRADVPTIPAAHIPKFSLRASPVEVHVADHDIGQLPVRTAIALPSGRLLVALGESGVRILTRDGRTLSSFTEPADDIVISELGNRAITIAHRGKVSRLSRMDVSRLRLAPWCDVKRPVSWARTFDGVYWCVASHDKVDLQVIDVTARRFASAWRIPRAYPAAIAHSESKLAFISSAEGDTTVWRYALGDNRLESRRPWMQEELGNDIIVAAHAVTPSGQVAFGTRAVRVEEAGNLNVVDPQRVYVADANHPQPVAPPEQEISLVGTGYYQWPVVPRTHIASVHRTSELGFVVQQYAGGSQVLIFDVRQRKVRGMVTLEGSSSVSIRITDSIVVSDDRGRILVFDREYGRLMRNLRLRA